VEGKYLGKHVCYAMLCSHRVPRHRPRASRINASQGQKAKQRQKKRNKETYATNKSQSQSLSQ